MSKPGIIHVQRYSPTSKILHLQSPAWRPFDIAGLSPAEIRCLIRENFKISSHTTCTLRKVMCSALRAVAYGDEDETLSCYLSGYFFISDAFPPCRWRIGWQIESETICKSFQILGKPSVNEFRAVLGDDGLNVCFKLFLFRDMGKYNTFVSPEYVIVIPGDYQIVKPFERTPYECWSATKKQKQD